MTLHPWPHDDVASRPRDVVWKNGSALGLLSDSLAVPLRFVEEPPAPATPVSAPARPTAARAASAWGVHPPLQFDALLCVRPFSCRLGLGR